MFSLRRLTSFVCGMLLLAGVAAADTTAKISMSELQRRGIDTRNFAVFHLGQDGRTILGADEPDFTVKRKGVLRRVWLIKLTPEMKIESVKKFDLSLPKIEQANFTPDNRSVLISSKRGSDIHKLDLEDGKLSVLSTHTPGTAGFRIHSDLISVFSGKVYTVGYFYDAQDVSGEDVMVEVNPALTGKEAFTQQIEIAPLQKQLKGRRVESLLHPDGLIFYAVDEAKNMNVWRWSPAKGLEKVDSGEKLVGSWGEGPSGLYCLKKAGGYEVTLLNAQTGQKTQIYSGASAMMNPCFASDSSTLVVAQHDTGNQVTYWAGQDADAYKLRKIAEKQPPATIRVSANGQVVCLSQLQTGLTLIKLDQK